MSEIHKDTTVFREVVWRGRNTKLVYNTQHGNSIMLYWGSASLTLTTYDIPELIEMLNELKEQL